MFLIQTSSITAATDAAPPEPGAGADDPWADMAARDMAMLQELAQIGMELARALARQAQAQMALQDVGEQAGVTEVVGARITLQIRGDAGTVFNRISRSVRLTLALKAKINAERLAALAADAAETAARAAQAKEDLRAAEDRDRYARRGRIEHLVEQAIARESRGKSRQIDTLTQALVDRIEVYDEGEDRGDPDFVGWEAQPMGAIIARLCKDIGVEPDWDRWSGWDWALEEARTNAPGSPYARGSGADGTERNPASSPPPSQEASAGAEPLRPPP